MLVLLVVSLRFYQGDNKPRAPELKTFEVEYLTPEEAARLLGEDPDKFVLPKMIAPPPPAPEEAKPPDER